MIANAAPSVTIAINVTPATGRPRKPIAARSLTREGDGRHRRHPVGDAAQPVRAADAAEAAGAVAARGGVTGAFSSERA
jgi:hypothetical protein